MYKKKYIEYKNKYLALKKQMEMARDQLMRNKGIKNPITMNYENRVDLYNKLKNYNFDVYDDCTMKDKNRYQFIAKGGSGSVYKISVDLNNIMVPVALKYQRIETDKRIFSKSWREMLILEDCAKMVIQGKTQNLPIMYKHKLCKDLDNRNKLSNEEIIYYNEFADGNFLEWLYTSHDEFEWKSFLFQFWSGVYILQKRMGLVHNDLRLPNILFFNTDKKDKWKYTIDGDDYYVPDMGTVFIIWDFGSSYTLKLNKNRQEEIKMRIKANTDLVFIHDLYKRMMVLGLTNKYTVEELKEFFVDGKDRQYLEKTTQYNMKKYDKNRFKEKLKISLTYYIVENGKFDEIYGKKEGSLDPSKEIKFPPESIKKILKELSEKYNLGFEEQSGFYGRGAKIPEKIPSPKILIDKFCPEFKSKKEYNLSFKI